MRAKSCHNAFDAEEPLHIAFCPKHNRRVYRVYGEDGRTKLVEETMSSPIPRVACFPLESAVE